MSSTQKPEVKGDLISGLASRVKEQIAKPAAQRSDEELRWQSENAEAIRSMNAYFEEHGFPFPQFRRY